MPETLCRVAVHHQERTVDLALPCDVGVGHLLPSIVDIVHDDTGTPADGGGWRLHHHGGYLVDEELTLRQNGIHDGDLLWLSTRDLPPFRRTVRDGCHVVAKAAATGEVAAPVWVVVSVAAAALGAGVLAWGAQRSGGASWAAAAGVSATAVGGALMLRRTRRAPLLSLACSLIAVLFAGVAGAIAAPQGPATALLLLAAAAACLVSTVLLRLSRSGATTLIASATASGLVAIVCMAGVLWTLPLVTVGTSLTALSLAGLSAAPRISMVINHIGPAPGDGAPPDVDETRAGCAHTSLTGLVSGSSVAATAGAALVTCAQLTDRQPAIAAAAFTAIAGVALMLRARTHADRDRRSVLIACGMLCAAVAVVIAVRAYPSAAHWLSLLALAAAAAALIPLLDLSVGPRLHRIGEMSEYVALGAVVPLGCWLSGVYRFVREAALL